MSTGKDGERRDRDRVARDRDRQRDRDIREEENERLAETKRRGEQLREGWCRRHPEREDEKGRPSEGGEA